MRTTETNLNEKNAAMRTTSALTALSFALCASIVLSAVAQQGDPRMAGFEGKIERTFDESVEDWPEEPVTGEEYNHFEILETFFNPYGLVRQALLSQMGLAENQSTSSNP